MKLIWADIFMAVVALIGGLAAAIFLYLAYKIWTANPMIWDRNRRISRLAKKYNQNKNTPEEAEELRSLFRQGLVSESVFVRKGKFFHRYHLSIRASVEILS